MQSTGLPKFALSFPLTPLELGPIDLHAERQLFLMLNDGIVSRAVLQPAIRWHQAGAGH